MIRGLKSIWTYGAIPKLALHTSEPTDVFTISSVALKQIVNVQYI